jgi:ribosome recycling factor
MAIKDLIADAKQRMHASVETVRREMGSLRTGRASVSMLDNVRVDYYGTPTPLNQVGNLSTPDPTLITIQPWDVSLIGAIEKAVRLADRDLNPQNDGKVIRIPVPQPTEERRKGLVKLAHKHAEEGRVAVRNVRRDVNEHLKKMLKDHQVSEDDEKQGIA